MNFLNNISSDLIFMLPGLLIALTVHEFAHAWVAYRYGDPTAYWEGRVSLNPLAHIDPIGLLCIVFFRFGWGKPVPISPRNFRKPIEAQIAVGLAGVTANLLTMLAVALLYGLILRLNPMLALNSYFARIVSWTIAYNAALSVFNLLPLPPLDGFNVLKLLLPYKYARYLMQIDMRMSSMLLVLLSWTGALGMIIRPISGFLQNVAYSIVFFFGG